MKYLDLKDLKITEEKENITTIYGNIVYDTIDLFTLDKKISKEINRMLSQTKDINSVYHFLIHIDQNMDSLDFETIANIFSSNFMRAICTKEGRKRERRLDVPENLKTDVHCSLSSVKQAINTLTTIDKFNVTISSNEFTFILVGDK